MFRIKICGVKTVADAEAVAASGADAIGLNFFSCSPRCVELSGAVEICHHIPSTVAKVGVFVNESLDAIRRVHDQLGLDFVQLHGDEPPECVPRLSPIRVIRALPYEPLGIDDVLRYVSRCRQLGMSPDAVLLDAQRKGQYGGTGIQLNWDQLAGEMHLLKDTQVLLAGGLTAENVAVAIQTVRPFGVDTASGVERAPGVKDHDQVRRFVETARTALDG